MSNALPTYFEDEAEGDKTLEREPKHEESMSRHATGRLERTTEKTSQGKAGKTMRFYITCFM